MSGTLVLFVCLGLLAGLLTTLAGMGGGLVLLLALAALTDPLQALALTAPALLLGNLHRLVLYRAEVDRPTARALVAGGLPGALLGGLLATALPDEVLAGVMLALAFVALGQLLGLRLPVPAGAAAPLGATCGFVTATGGGAGVLIGPFLLARGLAGRTYVATVAAAAVAMHSGRLLAYGSAGAVDAGVLLGGLLLALAISTGNLLGDRVLRFLPRGREAQLQHLVMAGCVGLALWGLA